MLRNPGTADVIVARIWTDTAREQDAAAGNHATTEVAHVRTAGDAATGPNRAGLTVSDRSQLDCLCA